MSAILASMCWILISSQVVHGWGVSQWIPQYVAVAEEFNSTSPLQNGCHFADDIFKHIFLSETVRILIKISLKFVPKGPINNNPEWLGAE